MGWFLITIALPLLAPALLLLVLRALPLPPPWASTSLLVLVKDGQLCWIAMSFCASALYDLASATPSLELMGVDMVQPISAALIAILVVSSIIAALGAVFNTTSQRPAQLAWIAHFRAFFMSACLTAGAALLYTLAHFAT